MQIIVYKVSKQIIISTYKTSIITGLFFVFKLIYILIWSSNQDGDKFSRYTSYLNNCFSLSLKGNELLNS